MAMLSSSDAMGKIQQIYMEGVRPVPYLTFMNVFNELLEDPVKVVPKQPSEDLKEKLRAACMAVNVGVYDTEGRGDDRIREFKEKILPVWKQTLSAQEYAKYDDIIEGAMRAKFRKEGEKRAAADTVSESSGSLKTSELLRRLGIAPEETKQPAVASAEAPTDTDMEEEVDVTPKAPKAPAAKAAASKKDEVAFDFGNEDAFELEAPGGAVLEEPESSEIFPEAAGVSTGVFPSIDELVEAVRAGRLHLEFKAREDMAPFARYRLGQHEVQVRLVDGNTRNYVIGAVLVGYAALPGGQAGVDKLARSMGYVKSDNLTYRRQEGEFLLRMRFQPDRIDMPCGYPKGDGADVVAQQIQRIHRDMGELLERLKPEA
jgi:hypothetical protein